MHCNIQKSKSAITIRATGDVGNELRKLSLAGITDLTVIIRSTLNNNHSYPIYGIYPIYRIVEFKRPQRDTWLNANYVTKCDHCNEAVPNIDDYCTLRCKECSDGILLCKKCHIHSDDLPCSLNKGFSDICLWCAKNSIFGILSILQNLINHKPRSEVVLKRFILGSKHYNQDHLRNCQSVINTVGKLSTNPEVLLLNAHFGSPHMLKLGYISKLYRSSPNTSTTNFVNLFNSTLLQNSFVTDIGINTKHYDNRWYFGTDENMILMSDFEKHIVRPTDNVTISKQMMEMDQQEQLLNIDCKLLGPNLAFVMRCNKDLVNNYNNVCTTIMLSYKYPKKNPTVSGLNLDGTPKVVPNCWGTIRDKNVILYILSFLHPRDWEIKDKHKRKGRLTIKNPTWAKQIVSAYKQLAEVRNRQYNAKNDMDCIDDRVKEYRKQIAGLQKLIDDAPKEKKDLQLLHEEAKLKTEEETARFKKMLREERAIFDGKKKRKHKSRKLSKLSKSENDEATDQKKHKASEDD